MDKNIISLAVAFTAVAGATAGTISYLDSEDDKKKIPDSNKKLNIELSKSKREKYMDNLSAVEKTLKVIGIGLTTFMALYTASNTIMNDLNWSSFNEDEFFNV